MIIIMNENNILTMLGFATKAGQIASGDYNVRHMMLKHRVNALVLAGDLNPSVHAKWMRRAEEAQIPCVTIADKEKLGQAIGRSPRAVVGILNASFAETIMKTGWKKI